MQAHEFNLQMNRLRDVFGDRNYSDERVKLIWREVNDFSDAWFTATVDRLIGECRHPPLMPEFRESISRERERLGSMDKTRYQKEAEGFFETFPNEEIQLICKSIQDRIHGRMSDQNFEGFTKTLQNAANQAEGAAKSKTLMQEFEKVRKKWEPENEE